MGKFAPTEPWGISSMEHSRLQSLTSLRGIAAVAVMVYHFTWETFGGASGAGLGLMPRRGYLAVDLFFILSGFVLAHVYGNEFAQGFDLRRFGRFLWARLARIYPVHLLAIFLFLKFYGLNAIYSGSALALNLLLLQGPWISFGTWNEVSWSISAEWHAYLLFPLLCALLYEWRPRIATLVAFGCMLTVAVACASNGWNIQSIMHGPIMFARSLPEFAVGILVYRLYRSQWGYRLWRSDWVFGAVSTAIVGLSAAWPTDFAIIVLFPFLLLTAVSNDGCTRALLNFGGFTFLGDISYSLYMVHIFCLRAVIGLVAPRSDLGNFSTLDRFLLFFAAVGIAIAMATLVSRRVEYPVRAALRGLFSVKPKMLARPVI